MGEETGSKNKRYYYFKMSDNFFSDKRIKRLRKMAGGDTFTIIYQKMIILSLKDEGKLYYDGVDESLASELALVLDEDVDNVSMTLGYLQRQGMLECSSGYNDEFSLLEVPNLIGSETDSARRMREMRSRQKKRKASLCDSDVTPMLEDVRQSDAILDIDIDIDIEREIESDNTPAKSKTKKKYGEFGWVQLTQAQYDKLLADLGENELARCIRYIDESAETTGNKNKWKAWHLLIRRCSRDGWGLKNQQPYQQPQARANPDDWY